MCGVKGAHCVDFHRYARKSTQYACGMCHKDMRGNQRNVRRSRHTFESRGMCHIDMRGNQRNVRRSRHTFESRHTDMGLSRGAYNLNQMRCATQIRATWIRLVHTLILAAPEASWRRVFDPVSTRLFDLYHDLQQNGALWFVPEQATGPSSQVLAGYWVRHPRGSGFDTRGVPRRF